MKYEIKSNDQRQIPDSQDFTFLTDWFFFRKKVPAKGLDPVCQALLSTYLCNFAIRSPDPGTQILSLLKLKQVVRVGQDFLLIIIKNLLTSFLVKYSF